MGVEGLEEAIAELREMQANAKDATPIMQEIAAGAASEMMKNYQGSRTSQGGTFRKLSKAYAARKAKKFPGKPILRATDKMFQSIAWEAGPDFAEAGPTDPKAAYHSSPEPRAKMPLRDPFYVLPSSEEAAAKAFADYVGPKK